MQQIRVAQTLHRVGLCSLHCDLYNPDSVSYTNVLPVFNFVLYFPFSLLAFQKGQSQRFLNFQVNFETICREIKIWEELC